MHDCCCDERGGDERFATKFVFVFIVIKIIINNIDEIFFPCREFTTTKFYVVVYKNGAKQEKKK